MFEIKEIELIRHVQYSHHAKLHCSVTPLIEKSCIYQLEVSTRPLMGLTRGVTQQLVTLKIPEVSTVTQQ